MGTNQQSDEKIHRVRSFCFHEEWDPARRHTKVFWFPSVEGLWKRVGKLSFGGLQRLTQSWLTKSLANDSWFNLQPQKSGVGTVTTNPVITRLAFLTTSPHSGVGFKSHLHELSCGGRKSQGFWELLAWSCGWRPNIYGKYIFGHVNDQIFISLINHNIIRC